ncbi:50S ribosomal protein L11 methyltransferase [Cyclobacterium marinum]|uniref:Ribosomal protein L11 methyltransferase n=1 Tax=Cyclobacterium marinum (strain ATCC 25205 / DSM 745 / LMG 13164 / NCIMB 1802) TaxID=880070 RepID=G0J0V1_CYCMS|nr:50S ribosomal protein L11 methyltransferase [Cyclobacterium marinum]AEL25077.1 Ribosomal protein L11 methyltransferase [Cyclobacterium marinum DSM 745]MBI0401452.1 50S ribosomal protein L11 methyltransferase [Cyclobacterium marinum]
MEYLEFKISCREAYREILMAELANIGFDSFLETDTGFDAYIPQEDQDEKLWNEVISRYQDEAAIKIDAGILAKINWNEAWEKNYDPISVADKVYVRATFHPSQSKDYKNEIVINPKMSFGTGHHSTTYLMLEWQNEINHTGKVVMDAGSGTGILAIMAMKLGADRVTAFDIDEWSVENGKENFEINGFHTLEMQTGNISSVMTEEAYDLILANINKNVLLDEMETYAKKLLNGGQLLLSGFYESDIADISKKAEKYGLTPQGKKVRNKWTSLLFKKE